MKCLMRMFAEEDKGVVFYETVLNIKWQKHTYIECVPVPWDIFEQLPAYFKVNPFLLDHVRPPLYNSDTGINLTIRK